LIQKYQKYQTIEQKHKQKMTKKEKRLLSFGKQKRFEPPKTNTHKLTGIIKTRINNGRRIENEKNKNEKAKPTKFQAVEGKSKENQSGEETRNNVRAEEKTKERRRCKKERGEIQHRAWKGRDGSEE